MAGIDDLRGSFTVGLAFDGKDGVPVYSVGADGFQSYVRGDDQATIDALLNPPVEVVAVPATATATVAPAPLPTTASLEDVIAAVNELSGAAPAA